MNRKLIKIGVGQAKRLCQMPHEKRLAFIAEGLPIILSSAQSLWQASRHLEKENPREASVLQGLAVEEAAKALILVDAARCPSHLVASRIGPIVQWFTDHLARLIYSEAITWRPVNVAQLREYVDSSERPIVVRGLSVTKSTFFRTGTSTPARAFFTQTSRPGKTVI